MANGKVTPGWAQPGGHSANLERAVVHVSPSDACKPSGVRLTIVRAGTGKRILLFLDLNEACELLRKLDNAITEAV